jgi:HK97 gp10 family phage protein
MSKSPQLLRLEARMEAIPKAVREAVKPALEKSGLELVGAMKALAERSRDSGDLIDSIQMTPGGHSTPPYSQPGGSMVVPDNSVAITVGDARTRYGHILEYGSTRTVAQPFFWPAVRLLRKRATTRIKRAISKAVKENWNK